MKEIFLKKRNEFLQWMANFIINRLEKSTSEMEFEVWTYKGLLLDSWCVDKDIWLK